MNEKQKALLSVARAYIERGSYIQYDQRSMDRVLELTPRCRKRLPPEAGNSQYTHFLDCSTYVSAIYLTAFGYELPSDLTWLMIDEVEKQIFYYELTHEETIEQIQDIYQNVWQLLQVGDLLIYDRKVGSGHVVMYLGDGMYTDCSVPSGQKNSYNYIECKNNFYEHGLWVKELDKLLPLDEDRLREGKGLIRPSTRRFCVCRPLDVVGEPLPQAMIRMNQADGLWCAVENSAPGCKQVYPGSTMEYTLIVRNKTEKERPLTVTFNAPAGSILKAMPVHSALIGANEEIQLKYSVEVPRTNTSFVLEGPSVQVNGLTVYAHPVLLGRAMSEEQWTVIHEGFLKEWNGDVTALAAAATAYAPHGIKVDDTELAYRRKCFYYHGSTNGGVLYRFPQNPFEDLVVYGAYGGRGVITPEMGSSHGMRITHITKNDLLPGDLLICMDDDFGKATYSCFYDGTQLLGRFSVEDKNRIICGEELERFIDSLFGRFAFLLLRPYQGRACNN